MDGERIELDGVLVALVDRAVASNANDHDSWDDFVNVALENSLKPAVSGDPSEFDQQTSTDCEFTLETDSVLDTLLTVAGRDDDRLESSNDFAKQAVLEALDVEAGPSWYRTTNGTRSSSNNSSRRGCPHETGAEIVHAALAHHSGVCR